MVSPGRWGSGRERGTGTCASKTRASVRDPSTSCLALRSSRECWHVFHVVNLRPWPAVGKYKLNILGGFDFPAGPTGINCSFIWMYSPVIGYKPCAPATNRRPHSYQQWGKRGGGETLNTPQRRVELAQRLSRCCCPDNPQQTANESVRKYKCIVQQAVVIVYDIICNDSHGLCVCACVWGKL